MVADALLRELAALTKGFAAPATSVAAAQQLLTLAAELCDCMGADKQEQIRQLSDASQADLTGKLVSLAERLAGLHAALQRGAGRSGSPHITPAVQLQLRAAWSSILVLTSAAKALAHPPALLSAMPPAVGLVLESGGAALASLVQAVQKQRQQQQRQRQQWQQGRLPRQPVSDASEELTAQFLAQLNSVDALYRLVSTQGQELEGTAGQLAGAVPWLAAVAAMIELRTREGEDETEGLQLFADVCATLLVERWQEGWEAGCGRPEQQEAVVGLLLDAALPSVVAALEGSGAHSRAAAMLGLIRVDQALSADALRPARRRLLRQRGAASEAIRLVGRAAVALPTESPEGEPTPALREAHMTVCSLAAVIPWSAFNQAESVGSYGATAPGAAGGRTRRAARRAGRRSGSRPAGRSVDAGDCAAMCQALLRRFPALAASARLAMDPNHPADAARKCGLIAEVLAFVAWDSGPGASCTKEEYESLLFGSPRSVAAWARAACAGLQLLPLLARLPVTDRPGREGQPRRAANGAGPAMAAAAGQLRPGQLPPAQETLCGLLGKEIGRLLYFILFELYGNAAGFLVGWTATVSRAGRSRSDASGSSDTSDSDDTSPGHAALATVAAAALRPMRRLHEAACRCVHWLLSDAAAALPTRLLLDRAIRALHGLLFAFHDLSHNEREGDSALWLDGVCMAHWAAIEAAADWLQHNSSSGSSRGSGSSSSRGSGRGSRGSGGSGGSPAQQSDVKLLLSIAPRDSRIPDGISLCNALTLVVERCPQLASARLCRMVRQLSAAAAKVDCGPHDGFSFVVRLAERAADDSRLAAALMAESALEPVLDKVAKQARSGRHEGVDQGWYDLRIVQELVEALAAAAQPCSSCRLTCYCQAASPAAAGSSSNGKGELQLDVQLRAALDAFEAAQARAQAEMEALGLGYPSMSLEDRSSEFSSLLEDDAAVAAWLRRQATELALEANVYKRLLQPAAQIGAALRANQQSQTEQQQLKEAVQQARAAATRSCSNLRCAELDGDGKSMPCSACRTCRYCCRACLVADWRRGGHSRVCPALATEREE